MHPPGEEGAGRGLAHMVPLAPLMSASSAQLVTLSLHFDSRARAGAVVQWVDLTLAAAASWMLHL